MTVSNEDIAAVLADTEETKVEKRNAELKAKVRLGKMEISGGVVFRWGVFTALEDDIRQEYLARFSEETAEFQRAVQRTDGISADDDFALKALAVRTARGYERVKVINAALAIRAVEGELNAHNPSAAKGAIEWPAITSTGYAEAVESRVAVLMQLDRREQRELLAVLDVHLAYATGLREEESGN